MAESPRTEGWASWRRHPVRAIVLAGLGLFLAIQLVPYGRAHANPPVGAEPAWATPQTRALASKACFDCHSDLTTWPWYTNVAPFSWLVQHDVDDGRATLDFTQWNRPQDAGIGDIADLIRSGEMPPIYYRMVHRSASLTDAEKQQLIDGLAATFRSSPPIPG